MPRVRTFSMATGPKVGKKEANKEPSIQKRLRDSAREKKTLVREYGETVRSTRKAVSMTLGDLSRATGIGVVQISALERGRANPTLWIMFQIARALRKHPAQLLPVAFDTRTAEPIIMIGTCTGRVSSKEAHLSNRPRVDGPPFVDPDAVYDRSLRENSRIIGPFRSAQFCEHANETPTGRCLCPPECPCTIGMCAPRVGLA